MIAKFNKVGIKNHIVLLTDKFSIEYSIELNSENKAKVYYSNCTGRIEFHDRVILINPIKTWLTINKFSIVENDEIIGHIKRSGWTFIPSKIILPKEGTYIFKRKFKSFWDSVFNPTDFHIELSSLSERIEYSFQLSEYFEKMNFNQRYRKIENGEIELNSNNLVTALVGLFLIELVLGDKNS